MNQTLDNRIALLNKGTIASTLVNSNIGLEKESLRVGIDGKISQRPHPASLGSALTHPYITTDFSEALLELITPPLHSTSEALHFLEQTHQFVYDSLDNEILWGTSMPCIVAGEASIPIAYYGTSHPGLMKSIYRRGLANRYGKMMQVIAGIHFNFSMSDDFWLPYQDICNSTLPNHDFKNECYFGLLRNLQRYGWLIPYLFGSSPSVCRSFIDGLAVGLEVYDDHTYYLPYATSLRLGDIGYQNYKEGETGIKANYDSLDAYVNSLTHAINTPCPNYQKIGVIVDNEYQQLNANLLQIENEYYSSVRPKQIAQGNEKPSLSLRRRGVQYVELRSLDINVFEPMGISNAQLQFLESFVMYCLFQDSPLINAQERREIDLNQSTTAHRGREPGLQLRRNGQLVSLKQWARELCDNIKPVAELLDSQHKTKTYQTVLAQQLEAVEDPDKTLSAKILAEMKSNHESFHGFSMRYSRQHQKYFQQRQLAETQRQFFQDKASDSILQQKKLEEQTSGSFEDYLASYFSQK